MSSSQIYDRGYREYTGPRAGVPGAVRSLAWHSARSVLGIGRSARYKILPVMVILFTYLPSIIYVGFVALFPADITEQLTSSYSTTITGVMFIIVVFTALVVTTVLVKDRRDGMLAMYLSTPLQRSTYVLGKAIAVFVILLLVTVGPGLIQLIGYTIGGEGPSSAGDWLTTTARVVGAGALVAAYFTAVGLAASSLTDRPTFAVIGIILIASLSKAIATGLVDSGQSPDLAALSLTNTADNFVKVLFGETPGGGLPEPNSTLVVVAFFGWMLLGAAVVWLRYRRVVAIR